VYYRSGGALKTFSYANLTSTEKAYFDNFCNKTGVATTNPQQCPLIVDKTIANTGSNLVSYLLGTEYTDYRARDARLGDIINGAPVFVGKPRFTYTENNYSTFQSTNASRTAAVFAGANDGMLHAFDRTTGNELWAFIPTEVLPNLYKVADDGFTNAHQPSVDAAPVVGDIYVAGAWKTILVGGLGGGGRSYYALDITDPARPVALWEFSNANLGLSFGNPVITKRVDGTWVVVFASGYNNNVGSGDGNGRLFVLNANTGVLATSIPTLTAAGAAVGSPTTPSGLAKINGWVDSQANNTSKRFYGGDLLGNLWRFDLDSQVQPYGKALALASLTAAGGAAQPITPSRRWAQSATPASITPSSSWAPASTWAPAI
jgi:type IV pilus assembly protein PilY1